MVLDEMEGIGVTKDIKIEKEIRRIKRIVIVRGLRWSIRLIKWVRR